MLGLGCEGDSRAYDMWAVYLGAILAILPNKKKLMWLKQCHKPPMTRNGFYIPPSKKWWFSRVMVGVWHCFTHMIFSGTSDTRDLPRPEMTGSVARRPGWCGQSLLHMGGPVKSSEKSTGNPSVTLPWFWPFLVVRWAPVTCSTEKALTL